MDQVRNHGTKCGRQLKPRRLWPLLCSALGMLTLVAAGFLSAQDAPQDKPQSTPASAKTDATPPESKKLADNSAVSPDQRQAQLLADTDKLLKLTRELQVEVAKSTKDTLSLSVIRKSEEVERLAKSLKERTSKSH